MRKALKWIGIVLGVLAVPIVALWIFGMFMPRDHRASVTETIGAPPERVFAALTDVASFPRWRHGVSRVDVLSREPLRWREETDQGTMIYTYTEVVPARR